MHRLISSAISLSLVSFTFLSPACAVCDSGTENNSYDFVVVGGGTAGLAVASRLSQRIEQASILVLEAGEDASEEPKINIPGMKGTALGTAYDWNFTTITQPHAGDRKIAYNRGKVLGGSSALNLLCWDRGSSVEYDSWEKLGNPGWNWESMIEAMLKAENFLPSEHAGDDGFGTGGPIETMINDYVPAHQDFWIPTLEGLGVPENKESLNGSLTGAMFQPSNIRNSDSTRSYSAHNPGYPSVAGPNLVIKTGARVKKINFTKKEKDIVANGVTLTDGCTIEARKEVILSAGTIQSPGLLELSGIGQKAVLDAAGIEQLLDLPGVGENLQDHVRIQSSYKLKDEFVSFDILKFNTTYASEQLALWNAGQRSMYDYTASGYAFVNWTQAGTGSDKTYFTSLIQHAIENPTSSSPFEPERSRIALDYLENHPHTIPQVEVIFSDGYTGVKGYPAPESPLYGSSFFTLLAALQHPLSLGSIHITSPTIDNPPQINPNYLAHDHDIEALIAIAKYLRKLASTEPLRSIWTSEYEPGLDMVGDGDGDDPETDEQWKTYVLQNALSIYHPMGTCAMLPREMYGVVDGRLRVYGTRGLRVVDASVVPNLVSGHPQTAVYGVAERAVGFIVEEWGG
ncbi:hypothetical protein FQN51_001954 [Onygenales sp. PD_10]|nr:hypothetical protein FQN51_001954 [Onygenales sp. PD_10]